VLKESGTVTLWGMVVANMEDNRIYFLKSANMVDWEFSNTMRGPRPECVDIVNVEADDGTAHTLMTVCGRYYAFGDVVYESGKIDFVLEDGSKLSSYALEDHPFKKLDYAGDSYATQSFYVDDPTAPLYGNPISVSWYSGIPNDVNTVESGLCNAATKVWNGGGFTIPVRYGATEINGEYVLTETPITKLSADFDKTNIVSISNETMNPSSENPLKDVASHQLEIEAKIEVVDDASVSFQVNVGPNEYTEFGWNATDGYYVDKTHASSAGIAFVKEGKDVYHVKYASGIIGESNVKSFYVLVDNNGYEVFAENHTIPFYSLTFASRYSDGASLSVGGQATIQSLTVNEIGTIWRKDIKEGEGKLDIESTNVTLDTQFKKTAHIPAYYTNTGDILWEIVEGENAVSIEGNNKGVTLTALAPGEATIKASAGSVSKWLSVIVEEGHLSSDLTFSPDNAIGGDWHYTPKGIKGISHNGDAYLLSNEEGSDFACSLTASLDGAAAAIIARASLDMSNYIIANYDDNEHICKVWTPHGELGRSGVIAVDTNRIGLSLSLNGTKIRVALNGQTVVDATLREGDPLSGHYGLNVFNGEAVFDEINVMKDGYSYEDATQDLVITGLTSQYIKAIYNVTLKNALVEKAFYKVSGRTITLSKDYLALLPRVGKYVFRCIGDLSTFEVAVDVVALPKTTIDDVTANQGEDVSVYLGSIVVSTLAINGETIAPEDYRVANRVLTLPASLLPTGVNEVTINGDIVFSIEVVAPKKEEDPVPEEGKNKQGLVILGIAGGSSVVLIAAAVTTVILVRRKKKHA
ncbi:MAG: GH32 C-terminal domain-containing protein, partial [Bacilli bacterium]|nr:GH32 C-terminal domain-containing protein [Bacilli bacterium]